MNNRDDTSDIWKEMADGPNPSSSAEEGKKDERRFPPAEHDYLLDQLKLLQLCCLFRPFGDKGRADDKLLLGILDQLEGDLRAKSKQPETFSSPEDFSDFFDSAVELIEDILEVIEIKENHEELRELQVKAMREIRLENMRPDYTEELLGQPWQQYLHLQSPGWHNDDVFAPDTAGKQRIPHGGMKIIENWEEEVKNVFAFMDAGRSESRFKSGKEALEDKPVPSGNFVTTLQTSEEEDMPYYQLYVRNHSKKFSNSDNFPMNKMLAQLEGKVLYEPEEPWEYGTVHYKRRKPSNTAAE